MGYTREGIFVESLWVSQQPPTNEPGAEKVTVPEVGCTSAPLESMAYHFGHYCKAYSEDFTLCKNESTDPASCLKEGRRVTRCAVDLIEKLKKNCDNEWKKHWKCLDQKNHLFFECRSEEREFNDCVFKSLGIKKVIPDIPVDKQVHEKQNPIYK